MAKWKKYKGRKLSHINNASVRPTQAKVKKSIFDILGCLDNKKVLDLYSGVGSFGIESLSRGAIHLTSVENNPSVFKILLKNIHNICKADDVKLHTVPSQKEYYLIHRDNLILSIMCIITILLIFIGILYSNKDNIKINIFF